jgi:hypothetical protein
LRKLGRQINQDAIRLGNYDAVNWDEEPGGRPMFDFMLKVRGAASAEDVPTPIPPMVAKYMASEYDSISAAATSESESDDMPTTGMWFWRKVDQSKAGQWVFDHRTDLWAIFYGSTVPNTP